MKLRAKLLLVSSACAFGFGPVAECDPPETVGEYAFAFKLETIEYNYVQHEFEDKCITGGAMPDYLCYFPITIPALAAQNLTHYAWMPWSALSEYCLEHYAPHGFFVYKVGHDGLLPNEGKHIFKKIIPVDPASEEATLKFRPASSILDFAPGESELHELASSVTFDDVRCNLASLLSHFQLRFPPPQPYRATELALLPARPSAQLHRICLRKLAVPACACAQVDLSQSKDHFTLSTKRALMCTESPLSFTTNWPFCEYKKFAWGADALQIVPGSCGSYIYEKKDGGIVYHGC
eukprot:CAMPEP_0119376728 /NCGR_PEP_ID=MMETSP1334-20130426/41001_1 /TAXON_ID=127549 /ORGANISM="Calcidiscus leptoporus, Strain RCC1130" /LENGTH=292 /DNA_ID=CAMNT_0007395381 /DNA_START=412 /DNA_END=1291 /DNA_ORIENTATION=+